MKIQKRKKGISLIALVITVIVMIILVGIVIAATAGDNGILNQSKKASEEHRSASTQEEKEMDDIGNMNLGTDNISGTISNMVSGDIDISARVELQGTVDFNKTKYVFSTSSEALGTSDSTKYSDGKIRTPISIVKKAKPEGTYYLHVLLVGKAGTKKEIISSETSTSQGKKDFDYTGDVQEYELSAGEYKLEVWGAQGGGNSNYFGTGGQGGYSIGKIEIKKNINVNIYVGQVGIQSSSQNVFNGGGKSSPGSDHDASYTGGGASDIRVNSYSLYSRIIVARWRRWRWRMYIYVME